MSNRSVLITGATGIMGGWVLGEALDRGYAPVVLMRDASPAQAKERLTAILRLVGREDGQEQVSVVRGDTSAPRLGVSDADADYLRSNLGGMIHCAACTSFNPRQRAETRATNVEGCQHVLDFLAGTDIPLYHVSTAYVAGRRPGRAYENELLDTHGFNNPYEESKYEAEWLVHEAMTDGRIQAAVFRPGILVGAAGAQGRISQFLNFYNFLRLVDLASSGRLNGRRAIPFSANPHATKNLVPVDWTAAALWTIIEAEGPSAKTYHLTNPNPVTHQSVREWANAYLKPANVRIDFVDQGSENAEDASRGGSLREYAAYLHDEPYFDRANTDEALAGTLPFPEVGPELYVKLLEYARLRRWRGIFGCRANPMHFAGVAKDEEQSSSAGNTAAVG